MNGRAQVANRCGLACTRYTLELLVLEGVFKTADF